MLNIKTLATRLGREAEGVARVWFTPVLSASLQAPVRTAPLIVFAKSLLLARPVMGVAATG